MLSVYLNGIVLPLIGNNWNKAMYGKIQKKQNEDGFTLVELLVAMAVSVIVMASIGYVYYTQQKSYVAQEQISAMQQNLRAAMYYMEREIRMAGFDPTQSDTPGIQTASPNTMRFTLDITDDTDTGPPDGDTGDANEDITYSLADNDGDGDNDLERNGNLIAENIDALDFVYLDSNGAPTVSISNIRSVQVTIVARTGKGDPGFTNNTTYLNQQGTTIYTAPGDNKRRRRLTTTIKCRNL